MSHIGPNQLKNDEPTWKTLGQLVFNLGTDYTSQVQVQITLGFRILFFSPRKKKKSH